MRVRNNGDFDLAVILVYFPPSPAGLPDECKEVDDMCSWIDLVI